MFRLIPVLCYWKECCNPCTYFFAHVYNHKLLELELLVKGYVPLILIYLILLSLEFIPNFLPSTSVWECLCPQPCPYDVKLFDLHQSSDKWNSILSQFSFIILLLGDYTSFHIFKSQYFLRCLVCVLCPFKKWHSFVLLICWNSLWTKKINHLLDAVNFPQLSMSQLDFRLLECRDWT